MAISWPGKIAESDSHGFNEGLGALRPRHEGLIVAISGYEQAHLLGWPVSMACPEVGSHCTQRARCYAYLLSLDNGKRPASYSRTAQVRQAV